MPEPLHASQSLLLDEPFAGVDPISVGDIKAMIRQLAARGIGVLITDHNVRETLDICQRAYIVNDGSLIAEGSAADILNHEVVKSVYLAMTLGFDQDSRKKQMAANGRISLVHCPLLTRTLVQSLQIHSNHAPPKYDLVMALKPSLSLKLGQQLRMTPQLQQAIKLLQLSTLDLQQEIQDALDSNLMLEEYDEQNEPTHEEAEFSDDGIPDDMPTDESELLTKEQVDDDSGEPTSITRRN